MKKILHFFAPLLILIGLSHQGSAQIGLKVDSLIHFPQLPDTAYQNQPYDSIQILVHNYSANQFSGSISVFMQSDSLQQVDTLRYDTLTTFSIPGGSDLTIPARTGILFNSVHFAAGDNIVVVWPSMRPTFPIDTFYTNIHFQLVAGIDDPEQDGQILLYPVPARQVLRFSYAHIESIEQVRIYDTTGRLMKDSPLPLQSLDVTLYPAGIYYVAILRKDGSRVMKKILKL